MAHGSLSRGRSARNTSTLMPACYSSLFSGKTPIRVLFIGHSPARVLTTEDAAPTPFHGKCIEVFRLQWYLSTAQSPDKTIPQQKSSVLVHGARQGGEFDVQAMFVCRPCFRVQSFSFATSHFCQRTIQSKHSRDRQRFKRRGRARRNRDAHEQGNQCETNNADQRRRLISHHGFAARNLFTCRREKRLQETVVREPRDRCRSHPGSRCAANRG